MYHSICVEEKSGKPECIVSQLYEPSSDKLPDPQLPSLLTFSVPASAVISAGFCETYDHTNHTVTYILAIILTPKLGVLNKEIKRNSNSSVMLRTKAMLKVSKLCMLTNAEETRQRKSPKRLEGKVQLQEYLLVHANRLLRLGINND